MANLSNMAPTYQRQLGVWALNGMTADQILALLAEKHRADVFVAQCKNGETWNSRDLQILDAWAMRRSYSPLTTIGYEIKVSRQDFERDQKWSQYTDVCHEFYFVCPAGLIRAYDVPNQVGIIWASKDKLYTKRRAERKEPDAAKLMRVLFYIIMSRSKIVANMNEINLAESPDRITALRQSVEEAQARKELAYIVRGHIRDAFAEIRKREAELGHRECHLKDFEARLAKLGIIWDSTKESWQDNMKVGSEIDLLKQHIDEFTLRNMRSVARTLTELVQAIDVIQRQA